MSLTEERNLEDEYVMHTFHRLPVQLVEGSGMTVRDDKGTAYLDWIGGIGVNSLGHSHPALVEALTDQMNRLMHVSNYYYIEGRGRLAKRLSDMLNAQVTDEERQPWQTFFANSGAEANECAIKIARLHAKRAAEAAGAGHAPRMIVTLKRSFHGRTLATLAATAQPVKQEAFQPLPDGFTSVPANDIGALERIFAELGGEICAMLIEPVQGESGVHPCTSDYLQAARRLTEASGALLMFDEVQCGIYRCGTYPFAFQHASVLPDVVTMAKGIAGGVPMGACAARAEVARVFDVGIHGSTFGGSCLAVRAANTVLDVIEREGLAEQVEQVGAYLREKLAGLSGVVEVRGRGLMVAADLAEDRDAPAIVERGLKENLLLNATGPHTLRFLPPLVCTQRDVDELAVRLAALL